MTKFILLFVALAFREASSSCTPDDRALWIGNEEFTRVYLSIGQFSGGLKVLARDKFKEKFPGMTQACRECHVNMLSCGVKNCMTKCSKPMSEGCNKCINDNCMQHYKPCLGVQSEDELPVPAYKLKP